MRTLVPAIRGAWQPLDLTQVTLGGEFGRRIDRIIEANILQIDVEKTFLADFCKRDQVETAGNSIVYVGLGKFIDAVVRLAAGTKDERLLALKTQVITRLASTQEPDGYIGVLANSQARVEFLWDLHEGAYLIWAFVSDYLLFGEASSLKAARRLADFFLARFAGNPSLRLDKPYDVTFDVGSIGFDRALLALSHATGEGGYRSFVVDVLKVGDYDPPIRCGTTSFSNHAYASLSHCLAQLDLYRQTGNAGLLRGSRKVMDFLRKGDGLLVTGSCSQWECWHETQSGSDNLSETCASAYLARLMEAMLQLEGDSIYGDILERDIYNALFAATTPDGCRSRYFTPFDGERPYDENGHRACCANNNKRFLSDLPGWIYYRTEKGVAVNLYNASVATLSVADNVGLRIEQHTDYPTSGNVRLRIDPDREAHFEVKLRIPRWCKEATIAVNDAVSVSVSGGQFYGLARKWKQGDTVEIKMPMEWRFVCGRRSQEGRAAVLRGPVLFTFNPERNSGIDAEGKREPRLLKINPAEIELPAVDNAVRPGGTLCVIQAWAPHVQPWLMAPRVPLVLTEYPDPGGTSIYFTVPGEGLSLLTEDELL